MTTRDDGIEASAGCIIFRNDAELGPCVLLLQTYARYDLPKGHIEKSDRSAYAAAIRETFEECGYRVVEDPAFDLEPGAPVARLLHGVTEPIECLNINAKNGVIKKIVYLFPVETLCPKATLLPNAKSNVMEHHGYKWEPISSIKTSGLHPYLQTGVLEAYDLYETHIAVNKALDQFKQA